MKKIICALFSTVCLTASLFSAELPLDGWEQHNWAGFKPLPSFHVSKDKVITLGEVKSKKGTCVITKKLYRGVSGDKVQISLCAKGHGAAGVVLYFRTKKNKWNETSVSKYFQLTDAWHDYVFTVPVTNNSKGETGYFWVCIVGKTGMSGQFKQISAHLTPGEFRGEVIFPQKWTIFAPLPPQYKPTQTEINCIPEKLAGVAAKTTTLKGNKINFIPFIGEKGPHKCGWAFTELYSPIDCDYTIGAGADWWMKYFLNGKVIFDTTKVGNGKGKNFSISNYVRTVRLRKGRNIIAVKLITGALSSNLFLGGPNELCNNTSGINLTVPLCVENFDGKTVKCTGNPTLIKGNPTPGLLIVTGQGVFQTDSILEIKNNTGKFELPSEVERYLALSLRLQKFTGADSKLDFVFTPQNGKFFKLGIENKDGKIMLKLFGSNGIIRTQALNARVLPADFIFAVSRDGRYAIAVNSLADGTKQNFRGEVPFMKKATSIDAKLVFSAIAKKNAGIIVDNYCIGLAADETGTATTPYINKVTKTFDPVKAGWELIFNDDFNGDKLDLKKWYFHKASNQERLKLSNSKLIITADWNKDKTKLQSAGIYTRKKFQFGYFEARMKFRKEPGWWSAFWLCNPWWASDPFLEGCEVDILEDYHMSRRTKDGTGSNVLDHNLHGRLNETLKSWNYRTELPPSKDGFYVIGCKWLPFEISLYLNGKLMRTFSSNSGTATFDPFNHFAALAPLQVILSGCVGNSGGKAELGNFPENFQVDYVRIYQPRKLQGPEIVEIKQSNPGFFIAPGAQVSFEAKIKPTDSPVKTVYLFDSGFLLDYKTKPPYKFNIMLNKDYYDATAYVKPGKTGKRIEFGTTPQHGFCIFAQDAAGNVSLSKVMHKYVSNIKASTPYLGQAQEIPGTIRLTHYDQGGQNAGFFKEQTIKKSSFRPEDAIAPNANRISIGRNEWLKYTVLVKKSGVYSAVLHFGTKTYMNKSFLLFIDGKKVGEFDITVPKKEIKDWQIRYKSVIPKIKLEAGKHEIVLMGQRHGTDIAKIDFYEQGNVLHATP